MSLFGFVSEKNLVQAQEEIKKLNAKLEKANEDISQKDSLINQLNQSITNLKEQLRPEHNDIAILTKQLFDLKQEYKQEESKLSSFQENVADGPLVDLEALHVLAADVQNAVDVRVEEGSGLIVRDGLDLTVIEQEGGLQQRLAVAGRAGARNLRARRELFTEQAHGVHGRLHW